MNTYMILFGISSVLMFGYFLVAGKVKKYVYGLLCLSLSLVSAFMCFGHWLLSR